MIAVYKDRRITVILEESELKLWAEEQRMLGVRDSTLPQSNQLYDKISDAWFRAGGEVI